MAGTVVGVYKQLEIEANSLLQELPDREQQTIRNLAAIALWGLVYQKEKIAKDTGLGDQELARLHALTAFLVSLNFSDESEPR